MYDKNSMAKKVPMDSPKGMCSYKSNPMKNSPMVQPKCGPGMNADQRKANSNLQKQLKREMIRGQSGM